MMILGSLKDQTEAIIVITSYSIHYTKLYDFEFINSIKGGVISKGYMPGIEKGIREAMEEGFLEGYPIVDVKAEVVDGKEHAVDSSELAFVITSYSIHYTKLYDLSLFSLII